MVDRARQSNRSEHTLDTFSITLRLTAQQLHTHVAVTVGSEVRVPEGAFPQFSHDADFADLRPSLEFLARMKATVAQIEQIWTNVGPPRDHGVR
jgi:hypothetical protein